MVLLSLLILCVSVFLVTIEADRNYTVVPSSPAHTCTGNQTECSLMHYATHPDKFFCENGTTFQFQAGNHVLMNSTLILMANISDLTLIGDINNSSNVTEATVVCSGEQPGGFSFYKIINLTIENLNFIRCSHYFHVLITLAIQLPYDLTINFSSNIFNATFHSKGDLSLISSNPLYVSFCNDSLPNCTQQSTHIHVHVFPGNTFQVSTVLMGQYHGLVSGVVDAQCINESCSVPQRYQNQYVENKNWKPTSLTYAVLLSRAPNLRIHTIFNTYSH